MSQGKHPEDEILKFNGYKVFVSEVFQRYHVKKPIVHQIKLVEIKFMFQWPLSTIIGWVIWVFERLLHFLRKKVIQSKHG